MYRRVDWAVPADDLILDELAAYPGWHTPKNLALNTTFSRQWTSQRCKVLLEYGLTARHEEDPAYRITDFGQTVADGEADLEVVNTPPAERSSTHD